MKPKVDEREHPHPAALEREAGRDVALLLLGGGLLAVECVGQPGCLFGGQPLGVGRLVLEVEPGDDSDDDRGDRDAEEHEAPALETEEHLVLLDEPAGERGSDDRGERLRQVEEHQDAAAVLRGNPQAQEEDRAGEESGLGDTEEESEHDELLEVLHPREQQGRRCPS
jgi:hypothetical protein